MLLGWCGEWQDGEGQSMNKRFALKKDKKGKSKITWAQG